MNNELVSNLQRFSLGKIKLLETLLIEEVEFLRAQARVEEVGKIKLLQTGVTMASFSPSLSKIKVKLK